VRRFMSLPEFPYLNGIKRPYGRSELLESFHD